MHIIAFYNEVDMPSFDDTVMQLLYNMNRVNYALKYLRTVPQMRPVLRRLPPDLAYEFSTNILTPALYSAADEKITINPLYADLTKPQRRLNFLATMAHELGHANQNRTGLFYSSTRGPTFCDTFRIYKLMEIDTRLLATTVENELLQRDEFKGCKPSTDCRCYRQKLQKADNDVSKANTDFVWTYWRNGVNDKNLPLDIRRHIDYVFMFYTEQSYRMAYEAHCPAWGITPLDPQTPLHLVKRYLTRMKTTDLDPKLFLKNKVDHVVATDDFWAGITVFNFDGTIFSHLCPTTHPLYDKLTYYQNNQPTVAYLRDSRTKENRPWKTSSYDQILRQTPVQHIVITHHDDPQPTDDQNVNKKA